MLIALKTMDESQLIELFHDLEDIEAVKRIAYTAQNFCENNALPEPEFDEVSNETSDYQDWKQLDDAQRYRDIKSTQDNF